MDCCLQTALKRICLDLGYYYMIHRNVLIILRVRGDHFYGALLYLINNV